MKFGVGHCIEKGKNVLYLLKEMAAATDDHSLSPDDLRTKVRGLAHLAGHDMTKVMSNVSDTEHETDESDKLFTPGEDGIEELLVKYGWLAREQTNRFRINTAARRLYELSQGSRAQSRTLMHEALNQIPESDSLFAPLRARLEAATQGEGDWQAVQRWCAQSLGQFKDFS